MSSQSRKRRAYAPEQWEQVQKSDGGPATSADLENGGKLNPAHMKTRMVSRTKVYGVLEESADGSVYLSKFESQDGEEVEPVAKSQDETPEEPDEGVSWYCPIVKAEDDDKQLVTGIVLEPETVDAQLDIYDANVIRTAAHDFLREYNAGNVVGFMHKDMNRSLDLVESWLAPQKMKIGKTEIKKGTWMMTVHVLDESIWKDVKEGKITGFSIGGVAKVQRLVEDL